MLEAPIPEDDECRLQALDSYGLIDTPGEQKFDDLISIAAYICQCSTALISLVDSHRQWFKSSIGLGEVRETPRSVSFCGHAIQTGALFEITDTHEDLRFCDNPLVTSAPFVRFYAGVPLIDEDGYALGTLCVIDQQPKRLNAAQKQALLALSRTVLQLFAAHRADRRREYLGQMFDSSPSYVFVVDLKKMRFVYANPAAFRSMEMLGEQLATLEPHLVFDQVDYAHWQSSHKDEHTPQQEWQLRRTRLKRKAGPPIPVQLKISTTAIHGRPALLLIAQDISDLLDTEDKLGKAQTQAMKLALVASHTSNIVLITDAKRQVEWVNPSFTRLTGLTLAEVQGRSLRDLLGGSRDNTQIQRMQDALKKGRPVLEELHNTTPDGGEYDLVLEMQPVVDDAGNVRHFVSIGTDITERKAFEKALEDAKEQAEAANRIKTDFLSMISHEIRTPLNGIIGTVELLRRVVVPPAELLDILSEASNTLLVLINDLLDLSRIEAGRLQLEHEPFNLPRLIETAGALYKAGADDKGVSLETVVDADLPEWCVGDGFRLRQVLMNLVNNAVKFTADGRVRISCDRQGQDSNGVICRFEVADTGIGIAPRALPHIFEAFTQQDNSLARRYGGSGLGLAICHDLVQMMGGEMTVNSSPGEGSVFSFAIKLEIASSAETNTALTTSSTEAIVEGQLSGQRLAEGLKVLIVDDSATNLTVLSAMLTDCGAKVLACEHAAAALDVLQSDRFDIVMTDLRMPDMNGFELLQTLRGLNKHSSTSVVAVTAHADAKTLEACQKAGFDAHLTKPITFAALNQALTHALGRITDSSHVANAQASYGTPPPLRLDWTQALKRLNKDKGLLHTLCKLFLQEHDRYILAISAAIDKADLEAVQTAAHSLKGSAGYFGQNQLLTTIERLELAARQADSVACRHLSERLGEDLPAFLDAIRNFADHD